MLFSITIDETGKKKKKKGKSGKKKEAEQVEAEKEPVFVSTTFDLPEVNLHIHIYFCSFHSTLHSERN